MAPVWLLVPIVYLQALRWSFLMWALDVGMFIEPYEGCRFSELVWFPAQRWVAR